MKTALQLIQEERDRQINVKGYTPEHDSRLSMGELANAAASYAMTPDTRPRLAIIENPRIIRQVVVVGGDERLAVPITWPFENDAFKPAIENRLRELTKAGALIVAEMERLMAKEEAEKDTDTGKTEPKMNVKHRIEFLYSEPGGPLSFFFSTNGYVKNPSERLSAFWEKIRARLYEEVIMDSGPFSKLYKYTVTLSDEDVKEIIDFPNWGFDGMPEPIQGIYWQFLNHIIKAYTEQTNVTQEELGI